MTVVLPSRLVPGSSPALRAAALGLALSLGLAACHRHPEGAAPAPSGEPSASAVGPDWSAPLPSPAEASRCKIVPGLALTLDSGTPSTEPSPDPDDVDDDALLPFGVDLGAALPTPFGFAVAGIRGAGSAFVTLLATQGSRRVDLGELHGDVETPALALAGERVLLVLRSTDAAGFTLKLGSIAGPESSKVEWGYELSGLGRSVTGVEVAAQGQRAVLVYQGDGPGGSSRLLLGAFSPGDLKQAFRVKPLPASDAEMPRLAPRAGGFWLTWVQRLPEPKVPPGAASAAPAPSADASEPEEQQLVDVGPRVVEVARLDEQGKQLGAALRVGAPRRQVLLYDVAALPTGGLLVAQRSDSAAPGAEGGALLLSEVGPDGSVREERLDDDDIGAGAPELLVDSDAKRPGPWLAVSADNDATRLGVANGAHTVLSSDPTLAHAEVLAVSAGHFLLERARGRNARLEAVDCSFAEAPPAQPK